MSTRHIRYPITRKSKQDYYKRYLDKHSKNSKKNWNGIKEIINIRQKSSSLPTSLIDKGNIITNGKDIATYFRPDRRQPFPKVPLTHMIIDECKYTCDSHFVNSTELKEKYTYKHTQDNESTTNLRRTATSQRRRRFVVDSSPRRRQDVAVSS